MSTNSPERIVAQLSDLLAPTGLPAIRTDYKVDSRGFSRRYLVLDSFSEKPRYVLMSPRPHLREIGLARMAKYTELSEEDATRVLDLAHELSELNDIGGWALGPRDPDVEERVASMDGIGHLDYGRFPALAYSVDLLNNLLSEHVSRVEIDIRRVRGGRKEGGRRRAWHYYYDQDGRQVGAHSSTDTGWRISSWMNSADHEVRDAAERYVRGWGGQLKVSPDAMAATFLEAVKLEQYLGVTRINLGRR